MKEEDVILIPEYMDDALADFIRDIKSGDINIPGRLQQREREMRTACLRVANRAKYFYKDPMQEHALLSSRRILALVSVMQANGLGKEANEALEAVNKEWDEGYAWMKNLRGPEYDEVGILHSEEQLVTKTPAHLR